MTDDTPIFHEPGELPSYQRRDWMRAEGYPWPVSAEPLPNKRGTCAETSCPESHGYLGTAYCEGHAWAMWALLEANMDHKMANAAKVGISKHEADEKARQAILKEHWEANGEAMERKLRRQLPGYVYYLRVGDLVKIGHTGNMAERMKAYPPHAELLARHPGTLATEKEMHNKFLPHLARGREWFKVNNDLTEHIADVRIKFAQTQKVWR